MRRFTTSVCPARAAKCSALRPAVYGCGGKGRGGGKGEHNNGWCGWCVFVCVCVCVRVCACAYHTHVTNARSRSLCCLLSIFPLFLCSFPRALLSTLAIVVPCAHAHSRPPRTNEPINRIADFGGLNSLQKVSRYKYCVLHSERPSMYSYYSFRYIRSLLTLF